MKNPEAWLWLFVAMFGILYCVGIVWRWVSEWRERQRVLRILGVAATGKGEKEK